MKKKNSLETIIEGLKEDTINAKTTREYMILVQNYIAQMINSYGEDVSKEQILEDFLEDYDSTLLTEENGGQIFANMLKYKTYKAVLTAYKGNKALFKKIIREAKEAEQINSGERLALTMDINKRMISLIRSIIRGKGKIKEEDLIAELQSEKSSLNKSIRNILIKRIQECASFLEDYGILDKYIEESNKELESVNLNELSFKKRNPIPDEYGSGEKDIEDIGVLDGTETEFLETMTLEDLVILDTFWESKYMENRLEMSKAIQTIDSLGLWKKVLEGEEFSKEEVDDDRIKAALKRDLILTYLFKNKDEITRKMKKQYGKFIEENNLKEGQLEDDVSKVEDRNRDLDMSVNNILNLQCLIIYMLHTKQIKLREWGEINGKENRDNPNAIIGIENSNFRGPLLMAVPKTVLCQGLDIEEGKLPKYNGYIDEHYSEVMAKLFVPTTNYFKRIVSEKYKAEKKSNLYASLAGKKVSQVPNSEGR